MEPKESSVAARTTTRVKLTVDGQETKANADYSLLFVNHPDGSATPVLYFQGRRVIKSWSLELCHAEPADRWGCSG